MKFMFYKIELVTQKKNLYKNFRVSNLNCDVILRNLISKLDFLTPQFLTLLILVTKKSYEICLPFHLILASLINFKYLLPLILVYIPRPCGAFVYTLSLYII